MTDFAIVRIGDLSPELLAELVDESERAGFRFLGRLVDEWVSGSNRFALPGEALFVAEHRERVIGVCGLNVDPYAEHPGVGRVRHLYVLSAYRRHGVGRRLVQRVIDAAQDQFRLIRLRTESAHASLFYLTLGFQSCASVPNCTHVMDLRKTEEGS